MISRDHFDFFDLFFNFFEENELLFWLSRGLNRFTRVTRQPIALLRRKVVWDTKNSYEMMH